MDFFLMQNEIFDGISGGKQQDERPARIFNGIMALAAPVAMIFSQLWSLLRQRCLGVGAHEGEV